MCRKLKLQTLKVPKLQLFHMKMYSFSICLLKAVTSSNVPHSEKQKLLLCACLFHLLNGKLPVQHFLISGFQDYHTAQDVPPTKEPTIWGSLLRHMQLRSLFTFAGGGRRDHSNEYLPESGVTHWSSPWWVCGHSLLGISHDSLLTRVSLSQDQMSPANTI